MAAYTEIDDPEAYFQVKIYTGDGVAIGSGGQSLNQTKSGLKSVSPSKVKDCPPLPIATPSPV
jgi:hypothetical protein